MSIISAQAVTKSYGGRDLFRNISFDVDSGQRLAVVGPNGCGKSTLLRLLMGEAEPDSGRIIVPRGARVGYAAQELSDVDLDDTLLGWVLGALPSWGDLWHEWEKAAKSGDESALLRLSEKQAHLEQAFGYNPEHKAGAILHGLGFVDAQFHEPIRRLSGGWRERAKLGRVLLAGADLLILDEPTNHLDLEAVEWLEQFILNFKGALILVVHDRFFLDTVATHVLYLGGREPSFRKGNFTQFLEWQEESEKVKERMAAKLEAKIGHQMEYVRRFRTKARKASQAQSKLKQVEKMKDELSDITFEQRRRSLAFSLPKADRGDKVVCAATDLTFAFPGGELLWPALNFQIYRGQKIALAAPNGAGKSTLLKLAVGELTPTAGCIRIGPATKVGYFSQHQAETLRPDNTVVGEIRRLCDPRTTEEELRAVLGLFLLGEDYFDRPVSSLSGGEKSRLGLAALFMARPSFLIMDEPTNHLDMESREALVLALSDFEGALLLVAHDRYLMTEVADEIWAVSRQGITVHLGGYPEYERCRKAEAKGPAAADACPKPMVKRLDKEEKRRQAEVRNAISKELKPRKEAYDKLEAALTALMEEQAGLEARLADPATYAKTDEFMKLTSTYQQNKVREEELILEMSELEEAISALEARRDEQLGCGQEG